jgi:uncharacterized integral membrane protein
MARIVRLLRFSCAVLVALLVVSFAVSNRGEVELLLLPLPWQVTLPVYLFGLIALLLGFLWGASHSLAERYTRTLQVREDKKLIDALRSEIAALRLLQTVSNATPLSSLPEK